MLKLTKWRLAILLAIILTTSGIFLFFFEVVRGLPRIPLLMESMNYSHPTEIFSSDGRLIFTLGDGRIAKLEDVSDYFLDAIIATEDHRFWKHNGVSKLRIFKALFVTVFVPGKIQGASTITQQLTKNLFFSFEKTYVRKIRELLVALQIETQFSKEEILEAYVNQISFGSGAYGVEQASNFFFDKSAKDLNLAEASLLAGLPKSPTHYNPYRYSKRAKKRQMVVLHRMLQTSSINMEQLINAHNKSLDYQELKGKFKLDNYFIAFVIKYLEEKYGKDLLYHGGLKVYTTMDIEFQKFAECSLKKGLRDLEPKIEITNIKKLGYPSDISLQGAIVSIDVNTGAVRAMVGGRDFSQSPFNRAVTNNRQPGSGFKPFLYYAAFCNGSISPDDVVVDRKISIPIPGDGLWEPRNFGRLYKGPIVIKKAFIDSVNTVAAQLVDRIGPKAVVDIAHMCGIISDLDPVYSVALGTSGVSPLEMASAFSTFASGGIYREPYVICRVEAINGQILENHVMSPRSVLDPVLCYQVVDMMQSVVDIGPGKIVRQMGFDMNAAGKTGTTNGYNDAWFTGFTPSLSTSVWIGFDKCYGMKYRDGSGVTGGKGAVPIWSDFMLKVVDVQSSESFNIPNNINFRMVDSITGKKAGFWSENAIQVAIIDKKYHKKASDPFTYDIKNK